MDNQSILSRKSNALLESASQSSHKLLSLQGLLPSLPTIWHAFGKYIFQHYLLGHSTTVPRLGVFTFTSPLTTLSGVTTPLVHDKQPREPLFIIARDFISGIEIECLGKTKGDNQGIQQQMMNYFELGSIAGVSKEEAKLGLQRIIRELSDQVKEKSRAMVEIPTLGVLEITKKWASVRFFEPLKNKLKVAFLTLQNYYFLLVYNQIINSTTPRTSKNQFNKIQSSYVIKSQ